MAGIAFNIALIVLMSFIYANTFTFRHHQVSSEVMGAGGFPRLIVILSVALLVGITLYDLYKMKKQPEKQIIDKIEPQDLRKLVLCIALLFAYLVVLRDMGFMLSTGVFVFLLIKLIGFKGSIKTLIISAAITYVVTLTFGDFFSIALPRGIGLLRELSYFIY